MKVEWLTLTRLLDEAEKSGKLTREECQLVRNQVVTLSAPKCPPKFALALAHGVNLKLGEAVVQISA